MSRFTRRSCLRLEPLERRLMFDVQAFVSDGDLIIYGTNRNDELGLFKDAAEGRWVLQAGGTTSINGSALGGTVVLDGVYDDVRVFPREGLDRIYIEGLGGDSPADVPDELLVRDPGGNNEIELADVFVGGSAFIRMREGADTITLRNVDVVNDLTVTTTNGADRIYVEPTDSGVSEIGLDAVLNAGTGLYDDLIDVAGMQVGGEFLARATRGANEFDIDGLEAGYRASVFAGWENDVIRIGQRSDGGILTGHFRLWAFDGDDDIFLENLTVRGHARLYGGGGSDVMSLTDNAIDGNFSYWAEEGNDYLEIQYTDIGRTLFADGGPGFDELVFGPEVTADMLDDPNWEV